MRVWVSFAAWTLLPFGILGLLWSLWDFSAGGIVINLVLIGIAVHDIYQLKRVVHEPRRWLYLAITQLLIGAVIGGSMAWLGLSITTLDVWKSASQRAVDILTQVTGAEAELAEQALQQTSFILEWGLVLGGVVVLCSQIWMFWKIKKMCSVPLPPPLPKGS